MDQHQFYMERAIELARRSTGEDDKLHPMVGCVIVKDGQTIAESYRNQNGSGSHAEYIALRKASLVEGATLYTTLEPCSYRSSSERVPCAIRIVDSGIACVYIGMLDPNPEINGSGLYILQGASLYVVAGLLEERVRNLNARFIGKFEQTISSPR